MKIEKNLMGALTMNELDHMFGDVMGEVDNLCKQAHEISNPKEKEPTRGNLVGRQTKMNYSPFENVEPGMRRCGKCGKQFPREEFKKDKKPGYDWKCKDCIEFDEVYQ